MKHISLFGDSLQYCLQQGAFLQPIIGTNQILQNHFLQMNRLFCHKILILKVSGYETGGNICIFGLNDISTYNSDICSRKNWILSCCFQSTYSPLRINVLPHATVLAKEKSFTCFGEKYTSFLSKFCSAWTTFFGKII